MAYKPTRDDKFMNGTLLVPGMKKSKEGTNMVLFCTAMDSNLSLVMVRTVE